MKHDDNCPLCAATKRVFGDRFSGCASISNDLAVEATKLIKDKIDELLVELETKHKRGEVTSEDERLVSASLKHSFSFAASNVPSVALVSGAECDPPTMMQLVQANMIHLVQAVLQRSLEQGGAEAVIEFLMSVGGMGANKDPNDSNVN